jgi:RNA polymerase-binding protein DksA
MNAELLQRLRAELETERDNLLAELKQHGADPYSEKVDRIAGIDDNFADSAAATAERSEALALIDSARDRLSEVDAALEQMDEGQYGKCVDCGQEIPTARLEARPLSIRCVECAAKRQ